MKCPCGYSGIPTVHHEDPANPRPAFAHHPHRWKCPACHAPCPADLRHDWVHEEAPDSPPAWVCSQCGMRSETGAEDRTPCPGHGANWNLRVDHCLCGEWGPSPKWPTTQAECKRCGQLYPAAGAPAAVTPKKTRGGVA